MPVNAGPEYFKAEEKYQDAKTREEKIAAMEEMIRTLPKHKGTENMLKQLKRRLAKLKKETTAQAKARPKFVVKKEGAAQVCIIGKTNSGKSTLLKTLTNAVVEVADYEYTTTQPIVGMMDYQGVGIQLVEIPSTFNPDVISLVRTCDLIVILLAKVVRKEVERQLALPRVKHETRAVNVDGSTHFTRPLPGAARMYPETDVKPITISNSYLKEIKSNLPEPYTKKLSRFKRKFKLSNDLAAQIINSSYLELFEKIVKNRRIDPSVAASTFVSTLKDLRRREKVNTRRLRTVHFVELFNKLARKIIVKEAIQEILKYLAENPENTVTQAIGDLNLEMIKKPELVRMARNLAKENPDLQREKIVGIMMSRVRGRADPEEVMRIVKRFRRK